MPSFLRVGSFELLSLPASLFFIGGCQQSPYWEGLHLLGEWVGRGMLRLEGVEWGGENRTVWGKKLVLEVLEKGREDRCWMERVRDCSGHMFCGRGPICTMGVISRMQSTQTIGWFLARAIRLDLTNS